MKPLFLSLAALLSLAGPARAEIPNDTRWHQVLACDNGAAEVDRQIINSRGQSDMGARVVIHDRNIVRYFAQSGASQSDSDSEWSAFGEQLFPAPLTTIAMSTADETTVAFAYANGQLKLDLRKNATGASANWLFRSCEAVN